MAFNNNQNEPKLPLSNTEKRNSSDLLPRYYRTNSNKKFLQATVDQLIQPGTVKKVNGYLGRQTAKAVKPNDIYVEAIDQTRQDYQFEPAALIQDYLGNTTFFKDYIDHINSIDVNDGNIANHSRLNRQEFYSWNPHIDWDKFVNYQQYYWLPFGPEPVKVYGQELEITSTYTVKGVDEEDNVAYLFTPNGLTRNPTLNLYRGRTYVFDIDAQGHPFSIKSIRTSGTLDRFTDGVEGVAVEKGQITFTVPLDAPSVLFYVSENAVDTGGVFHIFDILENTQINLEEDLLGKKTYTIPNGEGATLNISNGMKLEFGGQVTPKKYASGYWYVEGVGTTIKLVSERDLEIRSTYSVDQTILFDDVPFDQLPFSETGTYPVAKDYITINRGSPDTNPWTRYNRWFHKDVIEASARVNNANLDLDQSARATRPIIEFNSGIKLYNYGYKSKQNVDVVDSFTTDVFSTIEGSLGYNVDGIDLVQDMRVLFIADTDNLVRGKIYKVNFITITPPAPPLSFSAASAINPIIDTITFTQKHGLSRGNRIVYTTEGNPVIPGLINRQVYYINVIDSFTIELYSNSGLTEKIDIQATGTGVHVLETFTYPRRQIYLEPTQDSTPLEYETVSVSFGKKYQGLTFWYNGSEWTPAQEKTTVNQEPLFDVFDKDGNSFSDSSVYEGTSFSGTKIFSYKKGSGTKDSVLGFPLSYQNINNIGDILFDFNLLSDPDFKYKIDSTIDYKNIDVGFLKIIEDLERIEYTNAWVKNDLVDTQPIIRNFKNIDEVPNTADITVPYIASSGIVYAYSTTNSAWFPRKFPIDVFDNKDDLADLQIKVYLNGKRSSPDTFTIEDGVVYKTVNITTDIIDQVVTLECFAKQPKNNVGYYELPINLEHNPLNDSVKSFTLGEVIDHVDTIVGNATVFSGTYPGNSNLRDIGSLSSLGTRFVQHTSPLNLSLYHLGDKNANLIKALDKARNDYGQFKRAFVLASDSTGIETDPRRQVDEILKSMFADKPKSSQYYLSDMLGYTASNRLEYTVLDYRTKTYPLTSIFNLTTLSNKAVAIYLNGTQLIHEQDYVFGDDVFFEILTELQEDDLIEVYEYVSTDGCFIPPTPSKLGLYPKYVPSIFVDTTYQKQVEEVRILNTVTENVRIAAYNSIIADTLILVSVDEVAQDLDVDYEILKNSDEVTFHFFSPLPKDALVSISIPATVIQGHDGSTVFTFNDYRDELILELEKRIFNNIKVNYDPEIFDIYNYIPSYSRTTDYSITEFNNVLSKYFYQWSLNVNQDYTKNIGYDFDNSFTYNYRDQSAPDGRAVPAYWRGIYNWMFDTDHPHLTPWECLGFAIVPKWWIEVYGPAPYTSDNLVLWDDIRNGVIREPGKPVRFIPKFARSIIDQRIPVDENGQLLSPLDVAYAQGTIQYGDNGYFIFGDRAPVENAWCNSSYYPFALLETLILLKPSEVIGRCFDRSRIVKNKLNQFIYADTEKSIKLSDIVVPSTADSTSENRNYTAGLINYVVEFLTSNNNIRVSQYAADLSALTNKMSTRLGSYTNKEKYKILLDSKTPTSSGGVFVPEENYKVFLNTSSAIRKVVYSGVIVTKYADGYEVKGYDFNNPFFTVYTARQIERVIKVGGVSESYSEWAAGSLYVVGKIVRYNQLYYRVKATHTSSENFNDQNYARLAELPIIGGREITIKSNFNRNDVRKIAYGQRFSLVQDIVDILQGYGAYLEDQGFVFDDFNNAMALITNWETSAKEFAFWTTQGWSDGNAITLSPSADKLIFRVSNAVAESLLDPFYGYNVFRADGQKLDPSLIQVYRGDGEFNIQPENTNYGIFGITLYLVQKEHVAVLDNTTMFNDTIYDLPAGYHQERIKVVGYVSNNWAGGFEIPGFIYDEAKIQAWEPWTDYALGDIVKYKEFYYAANEKLIGTETFNSDSWILLDQKPTSQLLPNWDYRAEQFTDFYDLDTDNFDAGQQKIAQHLIGYQKRQYLENIIQNDVSQYKFYQGMIIEKGTQNVLNKLFDVLSADGQESLTFNEEWAFRVGEYGAVDVFDEVEFVLDESQFKISPQPLELVDAIDNKLVDFVYRQKPTDVYVKPLNYTSNIWPESPVDNYLRTPGYVRFEDIDFYVNSLTDLLTFDISNFKIGNYVWCAFENKDWNVYRFNKSDVSIVSVQYASKVITLTMSGFNDIAIGDIIGINGSDTLKGFYVVTGKSGITLTFAKDIPAWTGFTDQSTVQLFVFRQQRIPAIDNANSYLPSNLKLNEVIWTDNNGNGKWASYTNSPVYRRARLSNLEPAAGVNFGKSVTISEDGNLAIVADNVRVYVYRKGTSDAYWSLVDRIDEVATQVKVSKDGKWLAIANTSYNSGRGRIKMYVSQSSGEFNDTHSSTNPPLVSDAPATIEGFGTSMTFGKSGNEYTLVTASPATQKFYVFKTTSTTWTRTQVKTSAYNAFGYDIALSADASILAVSAPNVDTVSGLVEIFNNSTGTYQSHQTPLTLNITDDAERFGESVTLTSDGNYLAVGASLFDAANSQDTGCVKIYKSQVNLITGVRTAYIHNQDIVSPAKESNERFGTHVEFMEDYSLVVFSLYGDATQISTFDTYIDRIPNYPILDRNGSATTSEYVNDLNSGERGTTTTFDNQALSVSTTSINLGRVDVFQRINTGFIYAETLSNVSTIASDYGQQIAVGSNSILVGSKNEKDLFNNAGLVYSYVKPALQRSWMLHYEQQSKPNVTDIKKVYLYNKETNTLISYLDVIDPTQGKIPGVADQEIKYKTYFDPAVYSIGIDSVNVDDGSNWTKTQVGSLWWDLTKAKFLESQAGDITYRTTNWNTLYPTASIDVYEWVETNLLPSAWNKQADTEAGLAKGISGTAKYGDNVYSVRKRYDSISKTFKETYYYWVKNKTIIPSVQGRLLSAFDVARLITDPLSYGYSCVAFTGSNSLSLINCKKYLEDKNVVLNIQYWTSNYKTSNYHSEWKLLSTNRNTVIPTAIETKWFHSLAGKDDNGRVVPDLTLPVKQRYGIEFRPRQSMFINRVEALKQFIERINSVLKDKLIVDDYDISALEKFDPQPTTISGLWDDIVDTDQELRFVPTVLIKKASLIPLIENGRIINVTVTDPGQAYGRQRIYEVDAFNDPISWYGPNVTVTGTGVGAVIKTIIDSQGKIIGTNIVNNGEGYNDDSTILSLRGYSVLVLSDSTSSNAWSIYTWDAIGKIWSKTKSQSYDVRKFWKYIDWYATYLDIDNDVETSYNQFTKIDYLLDNTYQLVTTDIPVGSIIKIKNIGTGGWVLLKKINSATLFTENNYAVIGRQSGTVQFLDNLYTFDKNALGYDGPLFDSQAFDGNPDQELKIIFATVRDNLLTDELRTEYLNLFFSSVRYALHEQVFIDWAFKTSFVKSQHNVGELKQKVNYNSDNLEFFEQYIKEVKPYRTKVREYVSNYNSTDPAPTFVTDFDLLPTVSEYFTVENKSIKLENNGDLVTNAGSIYDLNYTDRYTAQRLGFRVTEIKVIDQGSGYVTAPVITVKGLKINDQFDLSTDTVVKGYIANGKLNRIELQQPGSNWARAPYVEIKGGLSTGGTPARAIAIIGNPLARTNYIKVKFDRVTGLYEMTELLVQEYFEGTGAKTQFPLRWSPNITYGTSSITVGGVPMLRSDYKLSTVTSTSAGYTTYSGLLTFTNPPAVDSFISIEYDKDYNYLHASDRINFFYNPTTGQLGKDPAQLMSGVDYGGVNISGVDFGVKYGWQSQGWGTVGWDNVDSSFEDYIVPFDGARVEVLVDVNGSTPPAGSGFVLSENSETTQIQAGWIMQDAAGQEHTVIFAAHNVLFNGWGIGFAVALSGLAWPLTFTSPGYSNEFRLPYVPEEDQQINIYISRYDSGIYQDAVRIDDPNFATINQTNSDAIMTTFTGDGETDIINLPSTAVLQMLDKIIFRKIDSDGSYPLALDSYDTQLNGGNFVGTTLTSATGLAPDDIILDGDDFVSVTRGSGPEEFVPGYVVDTLAIKVFHKPSGGCPNMMFRNHIADGITFEFLIGQYFATVSSVVVKVDDQVQTIDTDYTIDHENNKVVFNVFPADGSVISILSVSFNSSNVLDVDYFVADGETVEYITKANWLPTVTSIVLVNGEEIEYGLFSTDKQYTELIGQTWRSRVGIRFGAPPPANAIISYIIDAGDIEQNGSIVKSETVTYRTGQSTYNLSNKIGVKGPYEQHILVKQDQTFLVPPSANYFTMENNRVLYYLKDHKYDLATIDTTEVDAYIDGEKLDSGSDYEVSFDYSPTMYELVESSITFTSRGLGYQVGDILEAVGGDLGTSGRVAKFEVILVNGAGLIQLLELIGTGSYVTAPTSPFTLIGGHGSGASVSANAVVSIDVPNITFTLDYDKYQEGKTLAIVVNSAADYFVNTENTITFNDTYADGTTFEIISFYNHNVLGVERTVDNLVPIVNITPGTLEYYELSDKLGGTFTLRSQIVSSDFIWIIKNGTLLSSNIDYYVEPDLVTLRLSTYLFETDIVQIIAFTNTVVHDSFGYMQFKDMLNRIHYKRLNKDKATQLAERLNQNAREIVVVDASVLDTPNPRTNLPGIIEINGERIEYFTKVGNVLGQLRRGTLGTGIPVYTETGTWVQGLGASETIPYRDTQLVKTYKLLANDPGIVELDYLPNINEIEVFVSGTRLKKVDYSIWEANAQYPYPPQSDINYTKQFSTTGSSRIQLNVENLISEGIYQEGSGVVVIKRQGKLWNDMGKRLAKSDNYIANFLKNTPTIWPNQ
jgi:hypothetical protein